MILHIIKLLFPHLERAFRFLRTDSRQEYLIGTVSAPNALDAHLRTQGFEHQLFAWVDDGQIASLRKKDGEFQYHLRIFEDGEVRGHYEYAPECAPIKHIRRIKREQRSREFCAFVGQFVTPLTPLHHQATFSTVRQVTLAPSYRT